MTSYRAEVQTFFGDWTGNALRFATREEAEGYVVDPQLRWTLVSPLRKIEGTRVVETADPVNCERVGQCVRIVP